MPTADTPVPRQLSEEERALWEKARASVAKLECAASLALDPAALRQEREEANERYSRAHGIYLNAVSLPSVILSLLTALASEREAGEIGHAAIALHRAEMLDVEEHEFDQYTHCHGCEKIREAKDALALLLARRDRATSTESAHD